jgi:hypothetical protein
MWSVRACATTLAMAVAVSSMIAGASGQPVQIVQEPEHGFTATGEARRSVQTCVTIGPRAILLVGTVANTPAAVRQDLPQIERIMGTFRPVLPI